MHRSRSEILVVLCLEMLGPLVEYCTYTSTVNTERTEEEHEFRKDNPQEQRDELKLFSSGNENTKERLCFKSAKEKGEEKLLFSLWEQIRACRRLGGILGSAFGLQ